MNRRTRLPLALGLLLVASLSAPASTYGGGAATGGGAITGDSAIQQVLVAQGQEPNLTSDQLVSLVRQHVKYVFVIYQENRSFDSYFGTFPGAEGIFSNTPDKTLGFYQNITNTDGTTATIQPFRIGPDQFAADTDDVDHSHSRTVAKMNVVDGVAKMDRFADVEEAKYVKSGGNPSLMAKQFGELAMAYEDCDTVPFLWRYANRFVLFDHVFEEMTGPSTPGNLSIIAAQSGQTQEALHPDQKYAGNGDKGPGVPVEDDADPLWGSPQDATTTGKQPVNPKDFPGYDVQLNQTYASLPLSLAGKDVKTQTSSDRDPQSDLTDVQDDVTFLTQNGQAAIPWGWYEEGYDKEPTDPN
ncbi:MAG: phosphoesterase, partial [Chloroflexota bacterium]|nr:phosphoesterase [Chloroflexota bacterium]